MDLRRVEHMPSVAAVMTPFPYSVDVDDPVSRAQELMAEHGIRHVPVEHEEALVGVVTERDLARLTHPALPASDRRRVRVRQLCVMEPYVVDLHAPLDRVAREMAERHVGSALVTRNGRLAGIFTVTDACRLLAEVLETYFRTPSGGEAA